MGNDVIRKDKKYVIGIAISIAITDVWAAIVILFLVQRENHGGHEQKVHYDFSWNIAEIVSSKLIAGDKNLRNDSFGTRS